MSRKRGDKAYANYVGYQCFSSDMPTHRINNTNWYLKFKITHQDFLLMLRKCFVKCHQPVSSQQQKEALYMTSLDGKNNVKIILI